MKRFVAGVDRDQGTLFPVLLDDWVNDGNPVLVIEVFVDELDLGALGFGGVDPKATGRLVPPLGSSEDLYLRLPQSGAVEPPS